MGYYEDVYLKRLNRYGVDFQSRIQGQREENFRRQLMKSVYYVEFEYDDEVREGELTPMRQNETKTMQYLLTDVHLNMPNGTILFIPDKDYELRPWLIYYLDDIKASGYNRYIMLKMTHELSWVDRDGNTQTSWVTRVPPLRGLVLRHFGEPFCPMSLDYRFLYFALTIS